MLASMQVTLKHAAVPDDCVITFSAVDVSNTFKQVNIHKAAGPEGLPGCVLRACADQLASVFTDIFNLSLSESVIPTCFKQTTIVPVPKNTKVTCLNDRGACSVSSCTPCSLMTPWPGTTPTPSLRLLMTQQPDHRQQ